MSNQNAPVAGLAGCVVGITFSSVLFAFKSKADWVSVETGLSASLVLSTLVNPTLDLSIPEASLALVIAASVISAVTIKLVDKTPEALLWTTPTVASDDTVAVLVAMLDIPDDKELMTKLICNLIKN